MRGKLALLAMVGVMMAGFARADGLNVIEVRQAGQDLFSADFAGIRAVVAAKGDVKTLAAPAAAMARWMRSYPSLFPAGSDKGNNTKALPTVWSDPAGFQKYASQLAEAADKMAQDAKAGDADGVAAQIKAMGEVCVACHKTYRAT
jgi:cytochrome c556